MEDANLAKTVEALQKSVAALEERNKDLVLKLQIFAIKATSNWGWDRFLSEPGWWDNIIDTSVADCQGRCIDNLNDHYAACDRNHTKGSPEWLACRDEGLRAATACHAHCA
jgi:hypothetical protein